MTDQPQPSMSLDDVASFLFVNPKRFCFRVSIRGAGSSTEEYFQFRGRWRQFGPFAHDRENTPDQLLAENSWAHVLFAPCLTIAPVASELAPFDCLWTVVPVPTLLPERASASLDRGEMLRARLAQSRGESRIDAFAAAAITERLERMDPRPNLLIDEGDRVAAVWKLSASLSEPCLSAFKYHESRAVKVMHRIAMAVGGDTRVAALPADALITAPGLKRNDVMSPASPYHIVTATKLHDESFPFETLEA